MNKHVQADIPKTVSLTTEYSTPYSALIRDDVVMGVPRYFLERWVPVLGTGPAALINALRQLDYRCRGDTILISGEALAREAAMSRRHVYTCLQTDWICAFVRRDSGQRIQSDSGQIIQQANRYHVRMDDPLTPADADHLLAVLKNLSDTPLDAARRALDLTPRELWATDPKRLPKNFSEPRPLTALDVLRRAYPTWDPLDSDQTQALTQAAEALHRHITLVRQDGRTSKIIVPQYFRKRWWHRLGHDLAWAYLWLRGCVYDEPETGIQRDICWIPSLNTLLGIIGRPREWWRRNVEHASPHDGWQLTDFFTQIATKKGRDPVHPQQVARQFRVALRIPVAPDDQFRYTELLATWPDKEGIAPASLNDPRPVELADCTTPADSTGSTSATNEHTGLDEVCHTETQGSATSEHRDSESREALSDAAQALSSSKHPSLETTHHIAAPEQTPDPTHAAAATKYDLEEEKDFLAEQLTKAFEQEPHVPLYRAADSQAWLQHAWTEPVRPYTPAWIAVAEGKVSQCDLVALILAVEADGSVKSPPRYLSWLVQQWESTPESAPVEHWEQWRTLAELPVKDWFGVGRDRWRELVPADKRALPFGLSALEPKLERPPDIADDNLPARTLAALYEPEPEPDSCGLDERPNGGMLTIRDIWLATMGQLSLQLNRSTYANWVEGAKAVSYADGVLTVRARHAMARDWLAERLNQSIEWTVSSMARSPITIRYTATSPERVGLDTKQR